MVKGHGEKRSRLAERAIAALLEHGTIAKAAKAAGIGEMTLWRWLQDPDFRARYEAARRQVLEGAITRLQAVTAEAAEALRRNLTCGNPAVEVMAARSVLDFALRGAELLDLAQRLERLEEAMATPARRGAVV